MIESGALAGRQRVAARNRETWMASEVLNAQARAQIAETARQQSVHRAQQPAQVASGSDRAPAVSAFTATGSGAPCDGDLPPCWRIIGTESGGRWDAYNPGGCSGTGCWGPYQFGGSWAGKLGLPNDLRKATKEQWVNAARTLWNGGRGCANWSAC